MNRASRNCQNCKKEFWIEPEDFKFYEKIKVPPPTWCPECRMVRRMSWRNERALYNRKDSTTGKNIISIFSSDKPFTVCDRQYWWSDKWDSLSYGRDYNFSKAFFTQFRELLESVPLISLFNGNQVRSEYCNHAFDSKDCYLSFGIFRNEGLLYSDRSANSRDCIDGYMIEKMELGYEDVSCRNSYRLFFSRECENCNDSAFLYNCRGCSNCFGCTNLRNQTYHIFDKPYSKEEYLQKIKELNPGSFSNLGSIKNNFENIYKQSLHRFADLHNTINAVGTNLRNVKNCYYCFDVFENAEDCKFITWAGYGLKDAYDGFGVGEGELLYESVDLLSSRILGSLVVWQCHDVSYSYNCHGSNNLFACIGLRNKSYCILNKQYTKEEYHRLVDRIIQHMNEMPYIDKKGRVYKYGEFFPPELSPFSYNETIAQEYFPLTKEEAIEKGYSWKDPEPRNYQIQIPNDQLPDHIKDAPDDIVNQIIECGHKGKCNEQCTEAYKIIPQELAFLRKMNLPLPRLCPNCRHYQRIRQRNPLKLWHRRCNCLGEYGISDIGRLDSLGIKYQNTADHIHHSKDQPCPNTFETTYAPERPEIVYCEQCYLREVV